MDWGLARTAGRWRVAALPACLMVWGLAACSPSLDWRTLRPEGEPSLQATFPCKPRQARRLLNMPGLPGAPVSVHLVSCKIGDTTWALSFFDAQDVARVAPAMAANTQDLRDKLQALASASAAASPLPPVQVTDLGPVRVAGMTPHPLARHWRLWSQRPDAGGAQQGLEVQAWHFSHGLSVFQATVWRPLARDTAKESTDAVETFSQGFKFSD